MRNDRSRYYEGRGVPRSRRALAITHDKFVILLLSAAFGGMAESLKKLEGIVTTSEAKWSPCQSGDGFGGRIPPRHDSFSQDEERWRCGFTRNDKEAAAMESRPTEGGGVIQNNPGIITARPVRGIHGRA